MHSWGDSWEHWNELYDAQEYFGKLYKRVTKKYPSTKEKWGTLRYEFVYLWITNEKEVNAFKECIRRTIRKFPNVAGEVVIDAGHTINDEYFEGWCAGISLITNKSYWSSNKRPNGV